MAHPEEASLRVGLIAERLSHPGPFLERLADEIRALYKKIFLSQGAYAGDRWAPLKQATIYRKLVRGQGYGHILRASDRLFRSLTERGALDAYQRVLDGGKAVEVGTTTPWAIFHQSGTRHMPRRPFVPDGDRIPKQDVDRWLELLKEHITLGDTDT